MLVRVWCVLQPKFLPSFIRKQQETGADIVTGSRYSQFNRAHACSHIPHPSE